MINAYKCKKELSKPALPANYCSYHINRQIAGNSMCTPDSFPCMQRIPPGYHHPSQYFRSSDMSIHHYHFFYLSITNTTFSLP